MTAGPKDCLASDGTLAVVVTSAVSIASVTFGARATGDIVKIREQITLTPAMATLGRFCSYTAIPIPTSATNNGCITTVGVQVLPLWTYALRDIQRTASPKARRASTATTHCLALGYKIGTSTAVENSNVPRLADGWCGLRTVYIPVIFKEITARVFKPLYCVINTLCIWLKYRKSQSKPRCDGVCNQLFQEKRFNAFGDSF